MILRSIFALARPSMKFYDVLSFSAYPVVSIHEIPGPVQQELLFSLAHFFQAYLIAAFVCYCWHMTPNPAWGRDDAIHWWQERLA